MKLRILQAETEEGVDLTSMLDVVFLLVIFFMVTSTFIEEAKVYKITLPKAEAPETVSRDNTFTLSVTLDGTIYLKADDAEQELSGFEQVVSRLKALKDEGRELPPVILRCDARCEYTTYVQAKNALRLAGVDMVFEEVEVKR
ncbi:MAG: biopolymer transporter ExbD [Planctomycetes bacterium]|nr:biopolymer transporter ExbD [Planctomycetota bacterium]